MIGITFRSNKQKFNGSWNDSLKKALDPVKRDPRARGKDVSIEWQIERTENRVFKIGNDIMFPQRKADAAGKFQKLFVDFAV